MSTNCSTKVTKTILRQIKSNARAYWLEGKYGLDGDELVAYSYLKAAEAALQVNLEFDLPNQVDPVSDGD